MKKVSFATLLLMFGLGLQALAANTGSTQAIKQGQTDVQSQNPAVGTQTEEQNKIMNQGENTQIQTQEKNEVGTPGANGKNKKDESKGGAANDKTKSGVANAVHEMLQIAERNGGIGQQVRVIAQNQNQNQEKLQQSAEKIQERGGFMKFLVGPNYGEIKNAQSILEQNKEQIRQLNQIRTQLSNEGDQQQLEEQIKVLEQANESIASQLEQMDAGFSLFGWLNRIIS